MYSVTKLKDICQMESNECLGSKSDLTNGDKCCLKIVLIAVNCPDKLEIRQVSLLLGLGYSERPLVSYADNMGMATVGIKCCLSQKVLLFCLEVLLTLSL